MKLYGTTTSPFVRRVRIVAAELGVPFEMVSTATEAGMAEMKALSPVGKVPVAVIDGQVIFDSHVIIDRLISQHGRGALGERDRWHEANLVSAIDGALEAAIVLFYLRRDKVAFEGSPYEQRQLAEDGALIVKFFLHISKKEQKRRLTKLEKDKFESWRVTKWDWKHHKDYDKYVTAIEEMLARTEAPHAPWTIVEATDKRHAEIKVFQTLVKAMEGAVEWRQTKGAEIGRSKLGREARARQAKPSPVPRKDPAEPGAAPSKPKIA